MLQQVYHLCVTEGVETFATAHSPLPQGRSGCTPKPDDNGIVPARAQVVRRLQGACPRTPACAWSSPKRASAPALVGLAATLFSRLLIASDELSSAF